MRKPSRHTCAPRRQAKNALHYHVLIGGAGRAGGRDWHQIRGKGGGNCLFSRVGRRQPVGKAKLRKSLHDDILSRAASLKRHHWIRLCVVDDERWLGESEQSDKWIFCLSAARMPRIRREHVETSTSDAQPGLQGEGGLGCPQGREDAGRAGAAI